MKNLSICINTTKNEKDHLILLFKSLYENLSRRDHEIIVYIENDNQNNTADFLVSQKEHFPNLRIVKNPLPIPLGYQRNINLMFEMASNDIVSYLQSDMAICKNYDLEVIKHLDEKTIISSTRIEPPLHPPSTEKITFDFGLDPNLFDLKKFTEFAETVKSKEKLTDFWFAPFTLYKSHWIDIGGQDTLFRRSREDSDLLYRLCLSGLNIKQCWNALVYHFTCTSSRGKEWWKTENNDRTKLQQMADGIEMQRFIRKWRQFKHTTIPDNNDYKYNISVNFINCEKFKNDAFITSILGRYHLFNKISVDDPWCHQQLKTFYDGLHNTANKLFGITDEQWAAYKKYYRTWEFDDIFSTSTITNDNVVLYVDVEKFTPESETVLHSMNDIIHENGESGSFECENVIIVIDKVSNVIRDNIYVHNPKLDFELINL